MGNATVAINLASAHLAIRQACNHCSQLLLKLALGVAMSGHERHAKVHEGDGESACDIATRPHFTNVMVSEHNIGSPPLEAAECDNGDEAYIHTYIHT